MILLTDRSAIERDWKCPMSLFWERWYRGIGIVPVQSSEALTDGLRLHRDLKRVGEGDLVEEIIEEDLVRLHATSDQLLKETLCRHIAWVAGVAIHIEPLFHGWETVNIEDELILERPPLWIGVQPDRVLRNDNGGLVYREYKSTGIKNEGFVNHWSYASQLHLGMAAIKDNLGEACEYAQVLGLYKGDWRYGRLTHPYVWAYTRGEEWTPDYKYGWDHTPVWEYPDGIVEWVKRVGQQGVFVWSPPVYYDERITQSLIRAQSMRQQEIRVVQEGAQTDLELREMMFPQHFDQCKPMMGYECPYLLCCHNSTVNTDPLSHGYIPRVPHHQCEVKAREEGWM